MSDFIKGVQVGDEVKQYDYDALGNKPKLLEVDTTLTQSGKAADAKVVGDELFNVNAKLSKSFELIDDIVCEELSNLTLKTEPDGTPYNFDAVMILRTLPANTSTTYPSAQVYGATSARIGMLSDEVSDNKKVVYYKYLFEPKHGMWFSQGEKRLDNALTTTYLGSALNFTHDERLVKDNPTITQIVLGNCTVGTTIKIYGVRH